MDIHAKSRALVWFRRDLRLTDNPALHAALSECNAVLPLYIHAPDEEYPWPPGSAARWWLHHSLEAFDRQLRRRGSRLTILAGPSLDTLRELLTRQGIGCLYYNRLYEPALAQRDRLIEEALQRNGIACRSFNSALFSEPWEITNRAGQAYRVFTPFWHSCRRRMQERGIPLAAPDRMPPVRGKNPGLKLADLELLPRTAWDSGLADSWEPGEAGAQRRLRRFLRRGIKSYHNERDLPGSQGTSRLSPHLHFGEIGPRQIVQALQPTAAAPARVTEDSHESFLRELGWREFAYHLLHHFPKTDRMPLNPRFGDFPWSRAAQRSKALKAWQQGRTGIPIVDAGMRELWRTGWMHNRVRMIVASLLTKNLGIHWLEGARWFWDTLVDADLANNSLGWQWTAGCGADAAPYFRIFNPVRQGERFDPDGKYVGYWVPELAKLPTRHLHAPWKADSKTLATAGVRLGETYPLPMVDLRTSRIQALTRWNKTKKASQSGRPV